SPGDGADWSVSEDWEASRGIIQDLFTVNPTSAKTLTDSTTIEALHKRFAQEPLFLEVIEAFGDLDSDKSVRDKRCARHRAKQFFIAEGKLWRVPNDSSTRVHSKLECITQSEALRLAHLDHADHGHWGRDMVKLQLMDRIFSPRLDRSVTTAI
ncbi:hypothetical protein CY34DRAFT_28844, partial [Suillus luteus UH-Slu-Lm8-n1]